jgi:hypothetical protein
MRRFAVATVLILAMNSLVLAHGGGLDSLGCHNDRKAGNYHCHRGPLAGKVFKNKAEAEKALAELPKGKADTSPPSH